MPTYTVYDYTAAGRLFGRKTYKDVSITVVRKLLLKSLKKNRHYEVYTHSASNPRDRWVGTLTYDKEWITEDNE